MSNANLRTLLLLAAFGLVACGQDLTHKSQRSDAGETEAASDLALAGLLPKAIPIYSCMSPKETRSFAYTSPVPEMQGGYIVNGFAGTSQRLLYRPYLENWVETVSRNELLTADRGECERAGYTDIKLWLTAFAPVTKPGFVTVNRFYSAPELAVSAAPTTAPRVHWFTVGSKSPLTWLLGTFYQGGYRTRTPDCSGRCDLNQVTATAEFNAQAPAFSLSEVEVPGYAELRVYSCGTRAGRVTLDGSTLHKIWDAYGPETANRFNPKGKISGFGASIHRAKIVGMGDQDTCTGSEQIGYAVGTRSGAPAVAPAGDLVRFINGAYSEILGRNPSADELLAARNELSAGGDEAAFLNRLRNLDEKYVSKLYVECLDRPEKALPHEVIHYNNWTAKVPALGREVIRDLICNKSPEGFVRNIYRTHGLNPAVRGDLGKWMDMFIKSGPEVTRREFAAAAPCGTFDPGVKFRTDVKYWSCDRRFNFIPQGDGNVVIYKEVAGSARVALWSTKTGTIPGGLPLTQGNIVNLELQLDGNLVGYDASSVAVWHTATYSNNGAQLRMQNDGNLVIYLGTKPLWSSMGGRLP